mmetsp:Transcript_10833/g.28901  ORF Transcript_10833/g.28901 Transcript_10833/m.28901 type:complete len:207 (-) Transcript_10833:3010-3630(-)
MPGSTVYVVFHSMHCACGWPGWWWWWLGEDTLAPRASSDNFRGGRNISRYGPSDVTKAPMWVRLPWRHILVCCVYVYACGRRCTCFGFVYFCFFLCPSLIPRVHFSAVRFHNQGFHEILNFGLALHSPSPPRPTRPAFVGMCSRPHHPHHPPRPSAPPTRTNRPRASPPDSLCSPPMHRPQTRPSSPSTFRIGSRPTSPSPRRSRC